MYLSTQKITSARPEVKEMANVLEQVKTTIEPTKLESKTVKEAQAKTNCKECGSNKVLEIELSYDSGQKQKILYHNCVRYLSSPSDRGYT